MAFCIMIIFVGGPILTISQILTITVSLWMEKATGKKPSVMKMISILLLNTDLFARRTRVSMLKRYEMR